MRYGRADSQEDGAVPASDASLTYQSKEATPLKIKRRKPYNTIEAREAEELPGFAVLIGRKRHGRCQLIEAIRQGWAVTPGMGVDQVDTLAWSQSPNPS